MDETELKAAEVIARNIDLLENAYALAVNEMDAALHKAVVDIFEEKNETLIWNITPEEHLNDGPWLAPAEWRAEGEVGEKYDLYCQVDGEGEEAETWVAFFTGGPSRHIFLAIYTGTLSGVKKRLSLANTIVSEVSQLADLGFNFDARSFSFKLPVSFDREEITKGFSDDDLSSALAPIGEALDKIKDARPILDRVAQAVHQFNA